MYIDVRCFPVRNVKQRLEGFPFERADEAVVVDRPIREYALLEPFDEGVLVLALAEQPRDHVAVFTFTAVVNGCLRDPFDLGNQRT